MSVWGNTWKSAGMDYIPPSNLLLHMVWTIKPSLGRIHIYQQLSAQGPPSKCRNSSISRLIPLFAQCIFSQINFRFSLKVTVPKVNLWTFLLWGCTHPESILAPTSMVLGVVMLNQILEKRTGTGWWCWRQATNFQTMSVVTPARALSSLEWANQVKTFIATGIYHGWFYEPICNNGAVCILYARSASSTLLLFRHCTNYKI